MSKAGFMQRPLWISAPLLWISASAITDAYTVNTFSASYLDAATEAMNPIPYEETQKKFALNPTIKSHSILEYNAIIMFL